MSEDSIGNNSMLIRAGIHNLGQVNLAKKDSVVRNSRVGGVTMAVELKNWNFLKNWLKTIFGGGKYEELGERRVEVVRELRDHVKNLSGALSSSRRTSARNRTDLFDLVREINAAIHISEKAPAAKSDRESRQQVERLKNDVVMLNRALDELNQRSLVSYFVENLDKKLLPPKDLSALHFDYEQLEEALKKVNAETRYPPEVRCALENEIARRQALICTVIEKKIVALRSLEHPTTRDLNDLKGYCGLAQTLSQAPGVMQLVKDRNRLITAYNRMERAFTLIKSNYDLTVVSSFERKIKNAWDESKSLPALQSNYELLDRALGAVDADETYSPGAKKEMKKEIATLQTSICKGIEEGLHAYRAQKNPGPQDVQNLKKYCILAQRILKSPDIKKLEAEHQSLSLARQSMKKTFTPLVRWAAYEQRLDARRQA